MKLCSSFAAISLDQVAMPRPPRDRYLLILPGASAHCGHEFIPKFTPNPDSGLSCPTAQTKRADTPSSSPCSANDSYGASPRPLPESAAGQVA